MKAKPVVAVLFVMLLLTGCESKTHFAPVVNAWQQPNAKSSLYRVRRGDTLYSIAWAFGLDYRALAAANNLRPPYEINPGERLSMNVGQVKVQRRRALKIIPKIFRSNVNVSRWRWPVRGRIVERFSAKLAGNKGIDIAGRLGQPIAASAGGVVVYAGDGVRGYGNLIIVKHNDDYLSAYAYNRKLLVKVGMHVRAGQTIATMGRNNAGQVRLHFEIRRDGKPVNPLRYLS